MDDKASKKDESETDFLPSVSLPFMISCSNCLDSVIFK